MAYTEFQTLGNTTIESLLQFPTIDTPLFYPMFLFVLFFAVTVISFFREVTREGRGNIMASMAISSYVTVAASAILSTIGLIQTTVLVTVVVSALVFQVIFLLTGRDSS